MKTKRILALLMAMAMTAGVLGGCSSGDTGSTSGDSTSSDTSDNTSQTGEAPTVSWYTIGGDEPGNFAEAVHALSDYAEGKINVKLNLVLSNWNSYRDRFNTMINGGDKFDIMFTDSQTYSRYVHQGAFLDITDKVQSVTPDMYKAIPENLWEGVKVGGKIYSVPTYKDSSLTQFWWYDKAYVDKYNLDVQSVKTMDDLTEIFKTVKEGEGDDFYPVNLNQGNPWNGFWNDYDDLCTGMGGLLGVKLDDESRKVVSVLEQEDIMHNLNLLHEWYQAGYINPDANVSGENYTQCFFGNGQSWPSEATNQAKSQGVDEYIYVQHGDTILTSATIQGSLNAISANSANADAALQLLQLANTDTEFRDMLHFGQKGVDWDYNDEGVVEQVEGQTWTTGPTNYAQANYFILTRSTDEAETKYDEIKSQNENAKESVCLGFTFDPTNVQTQIAACSAVWSQSAKADLLTGAVDPEERVPQLLEELKAAGLQEVIDEAQRQIDEYFA